MPVIEELTVVEETLMVLLDPVVSALLEEDAVDVDVAVVEVVVTV